MRSNHRELKKRAWAANLEIARRGLAIYTFGNASAFDREAGLVAIKPSGVAYEDLSVEDIVVLDLEGKIVEGRLRPSSDTRTHLVLFREMPGLGGVVHTHSTYATGWAQAASPIPILGTTHADYLAEDVARQSATGAPAPPRARARPPKAAAEWTARGDLSVCMENLPAVTGGLASVMRAFATRRSLESGEAYEANLRHCVHGLSRDHHRVRRACAGGQEDRPRLLADRRREPVADPHLQ